MKLEPGGFVSVVEVAPRTGLVFPHHYGDAYPRYPPLRVGMIRWMIVFGVGVATGRGVHSDEGYLVCSTHDWR